MPRGQLTDGRNAELQALRAIAALSVLLFHARISLPATSGLDALKGCLFFGFVGVDIFFVVSGYVVTWTATRIHSFADARLFVLRRVGRIYGGYWPVLALCAVLPLFAVPSVHPGGQWLSSALLIQPVMDSNVLPVAYTLVYELWFYALLTAAMVCVTTASGRRNLLIASAAFLLGWQAVLMLSDFQAWRTGQVPLPFFLSGLLLEFLAGALIYFYRQSMTVFVQRCAALVLLAGGLSAMVAFWPLFGLTLVRAAIGGAVGAGALLLALSWQAHAAPGNKPGWWHRLGDASYSLYLLHTLVLATLTTVAGWLAPDVPGASIAVALVGIPLSVGFALTWYRWIERPIYRVWCDWVAGRAAH